MKGAEEPEMTVHALPQNEWNFRERQPTNEPMNETRTTRQASK